MRASVAPGDHSALAEAMIQAATRTPDPRLRERVLQRYSTECMAAAYVATYTEAFREHERAVA